MTRIPMVDPAETTGRVRAMLDGVAAKRGRVPAMVRVLANAPAALSGYFSLHAALGTGVLEPALREQIAIAVAEANGCATCLAAHTEFGRQEGLSETELDRARDAYATDPATATALRFALTVMRSVGHVADADLVAMKSHGFDDAAILEIVAVVFMNVFTNAVNHVAGTSPDYPAVPARAVAP
jgi:uncharacterized peroxidase-related enzyme